MLRYAGVAVIAVIVECCFYGGAAQYDSCTSGVVANISNGRCDAEMNVRSCGYDGIDRCPCICVDGPAHSCSDSEFDCVHPQCDNSAAASTKECAKMTGKAMCKCTARSKGCCGWKTSPGIGRVRDLTS